MKRTKSKPGPWAKYGMRRNEMKGSVNERLTVDFMKSHIYEL